MNPLKERRERNLLSAWDHRSSLVFDERTARTHRLTCLEQDLTDSDRLCDLAEVIADVVASNIESIVIDLSRVRNADSKLVGMLLHLKRAARDRGVGLRVFLSDHIEQWVTVCRVEGLLIDAAPDPGPPAHSHPPRRPRGRSPARLAG